eukprot:2815956-Amphidinium_carterae.1
MTYKFGTRVWKYQLKHQADILRLQVVMRNHEPPAAPSVEPAPARMDQVGACSGQLRTVREE